MIIILLILWVLRPFLNTKNTTKNKDNLDRVLDQNSFKQQNTVLMIIATLVLLALVLWILPKFGIKLPALLQKIIPIVSSLRSILPF
tara:strand:- start:264 stop:524 length:261 start_codon:yes stop_codon:yes gene_type:complete